MAETKTTTATAATTILKKGSCRACGGSGHGIDHRATGKALALRRMALGLKQTDIGARMKISGSYVSELEAGERSWTAALVASYEKALQW